jgi:hypothetical protein
MGWFSRKEEQQLPVFTEVDELVGKQATDSEGTPGVITGVYVFPDGTKSVDLTVRGGITGHVTYGGLDSDEYRLNP